MGLVSGEIEERDGNVGKFTEFQEVDSFSTKRPVRPAAPTHPFPHLRLFAARYRHTPESALLVLAIVEILAVRGFLRGNAVMFCDQNGGTFREVNSPNMKMFRAAFRCEVEGLSVS